MRVSLKTSRKYHLSEKLVQQVLTSTFPHDTALVTIQFSCRHTPNRIRSTSAGEREWRGVLLVFLVALMVREGLALVARLDVYRGVVHVLQGQAVPPTNVKNSVKSVEHLNSYAAQYSCCITYNAAGIGVATPGDGRKGMRVHLTPLVASYA